jgi:hypothetical protein
VLNLVGLWEVRLAGGGTKPAGEYTFFYGKGNENLELGAVGKNKTYKKYICFLSCDCNFK